jgi:two-component system sensor histidine kinase YesM
MKLKQTYMAAMNNLKIKHKLIVLYCFTFFLPLLFVSILFISRLYNTLLGWERQQADASFQRTESIFGDVLNSVSELSDRLYVNKPVQDIIQTRYTNTKDIYNAYASISFVDDFLRAYESVASIRLYTDNQMLLDNSFIEKTTPDVHSEQWYVQAIAMKGQPFWTYKRDTITGKMYLSLVRSVWRTMDRTFIGVLSINLNPFYMNKTLDTQIFDTYVVYDSTVIYSTKHMTDSSIGRILSAASSKSGSAVSIEGRKSEALTGTFHPDHGKFQDSCRIKI